ncbi:MAG: orotidine-5'-phosphate decarboxylase [Candidatus Omnitrophica bacterium]|nr:orotidine-5'-phosphate decarboxylase [Candidatus Omnitrophota bacterium]
MKKPELIVALDVGSGKEAIQLVELLKNEVDIFKVGGQLFSIEGPHIIRDIQARGKRVFLDLKFHDIPNTVSYSTMGAIVSTSSTTINFTTQFPPKNPSLDIPGLFMFTVHTQGGEGMLKAAVEASRKTAKKLNIVPPLVVGVTVLTSENEPNVINTVLTKAKLAKKSGLDGVVVSVQEVRAIRDELGDEFVIVTPGIRPLGESAGDQKRIATPAEAIAAGSNYLVVGRPIVQATNPYKAAKEILKEMES